MIIEGDAQIGVNVTQLDPSTVASEVWYGKVSGNYTANRTGISEVYSQLYPFEGLFNYTSGIIHHVRIDGMFELYAYYWRMTIPHLSISFSFKMRWNPFTYDYLA